MTQSLADSYADIMLLAGVDEVGRGPLAGPVVAAAVILDPDNPIAGLMDSKKMSETKRTEKAAEIRQKAMAWAMGRAEVEEIDQINILQASLLAMTRAIHCLSVVPELVLVDGNKLPKISMAAEAIVKGDQKIPAISAASIIAKVARDYEMRLMSKRFPGYGLHQHKGYPTKQHLLALNELGVTRIHRRSFSPVRKLLESVD